MSIAQLIRQLKLTGNVNLNKNFNEAPNDVHLTLQAIKKIQNPIDKKT